MVSVRCGGELLGRGGWGVRGWEPVACSNPPDRVE